MYSSANQMLTYLLLWFGVCACSRTSPQFRGETPSQANQFAAGTDASGIADAEKNSFVPSEKRRVSSNRDWVAVVSHQKSRQELCPDGYLIVGEWSDIDQQLWTLCVKRGVTLTRDEIVDSDDWKKQRRTKKIERPK